MSIKWSADVTWLALIAKLYLILKPNTTGIYSSIVNMSKSNAMSVTKALPDINSDFLLISAISTQLNRL